jgi:hypothetical protein
MWYVVPIFKDQIFRSDFLRSFMQFQNHDITSDKWSDQNNERFYHVKQTVENRRPSKMGDVATLLFVHFHFIIQLRNMFLFLKSIHIAYLVKFMLCLLSFIRLFLFFFFKDMHYNTMIRTFCILKKMTVDAFHYLTLSVHCGELDAHIN